MESSAGLCFLKCEEEVSGWASATRIYYIALIAKVAGITADANGHGVQGLDYDAVYGSDPCTTTHFCGLFPELAGTGAHELGHATGLGHAPFNTGGCFDPAWPGGGGDDQSHNPTPYKAASIGVDGWDPMSLDAPPPGLTSPDPDLVGTYLRSLPHDPSSVLAKDFMSYIDLNADPRQIYWVSDYTFQWIYLYNNVVNK